MCRAASPAAYVLVLLLRLACSFVHHSASDLALGNVTIPADQSCWMSASEACSVSAMDRDRSTFVYPGGETACLNGDYAFEVIPGDTDKLAIYMQGGGACWSQATYLAPGPACWKTAARNDPDKAGIFDRTNPANPFQNFTLIHIMYCSGDLHIGRSNHTWLVPGSYQKRPVLQRGFDNAFSAIGWAVENFPIVKSLVLTGTSAGALGLQLWSYRMLHSFQYETASVIADSFTGVFPHGTEGWFVNEFHTCDIGLCGAGYNLRLSSECHELMQRCFDHSAKIQDMYDLTMTAFPEVTFANVDSKRDNRQVIFYELVAALHRKTPTTSLALYKAMNRVRRRYSRHHNYASFLIESSHADYLSHPEFYSAGTGGAYGAKGRPLALWIGDVVRGVARNECAGTRRKRRGLLTGTRFCDPALDDRQ